MKSEQGELKFFASFPTKETLRLLLEWHALYEELQLEKKKMSLCSETDAIKLLDIPARKLHQYVKEGYLKTKPSGEFYKYQVIKLLFEVKQEELYQSIS